MQPTSLRAGHVCETEDVLMLLTVFDPEDCIFVCFSLNLPQNVTW